MYKYHSGPKYSSDPVKVIVPIGEPIGSIGTRQMSLNPETIEIIRMYCDVGQIETTKIYANRDFFWKDDKTIEVFNPYGTIYHLSVSPMKTIDRIKQMKSTIEQPNWKESLKRNLALRYGNPWNSVYYEDPRERR